MNIISSDYFLECLFKKSIFITQLRIKNPKIEIDFKEFK